MTIARWLIAAALICVAQVPPSSAAQTLSVNTTSSAPLAVPRQDGYHDLIAIEMFKRIGKSITIQILPGERSLLNLDQGIDDATLVRIRGIENAYPNVRMVPEKIMDMEFVAFTIDPNVEVKEWADLRSYSVAFINGWKIFEQNTRNAAFVTKVNGPSQLFDLLALGRADVILFEKWMGLHIVDVRGMTQVRNLSPPLATKEMFMYVHNKHIALVDRLATALRSMKADGTYDNFYRRILEPLLAGR
jgi:polar amino acid transport system substrate-binding protein